MHQNNEALGGLIKVEHVVSLRTNREMMQFLCHRILRENGELQTKNNVIDHYDVFGNLRKVEHPGKGVEYVIDARNRWMKC